jgi:F-box/WD-40 domain protein MET30
MTDISTTDPHAALLQGHDHDGIGMRTRHQFEEAEAREPAFEHREGRYLNKAATKQSEKMMTPFLAQHIPRQYNPLGGDRHLHDEIISQPNTKYCYRHRPDVLCRRQADEPTMDQLQQVCTNNICLCR